ncbi:MAG: PH domain-containing protein [Emergencia sp.]
MSQGPINRKLGLYKVELFLASGIFEIVGLNQETADRISENLKSRLYRRISEKGDVL